MNAEGEKSGEKDLAKDKLKKKKGGDDNDDDGNVNCPCTEPINDGDADTEVGDDDTREEPVVDAVE
jgi:hypothetical protein